MRKTKSRRKIQVTLITLARGLTLCPRGRTIMSDTEQNRLQEAHENGQAWSRWGPYLSERQWGTVREDYSPGGTAWDFLPHDQARSHAYRWGEGRPVGDQRRSAAALFRPGPVERGRPHPEGTALRTDELGG